MLNVTISSQQGQKKEALATSTSALVLYQLFEQILYIPLIVFSFLHQPTDAVCLIPLLQKLGERPIECGLPPLDHAAILLHGIRCFADGQPLGKAFPEEIGVVVEHRFKRLLGKCKILAHGLICLAVGYADVLLPFPDEFVSPQIHPVVFADVLGVFVVGSAATDGALRILVINISEGLAPGLRKAVLIHFADSDFVDLAPGLTDVFIPQHTIHLDLLAEGGVPDEVVMLVVFFGKTGVLADHDGLAGVDVLQHPDNEDGLSVVPRIKPGKQIVPRSLAVVGMNIVISLINLFIPSASAKAAILVPIVTPLCETLGVTLQVGVQSFLYGDKLTNIISPVLGTTVAGLAMCRIDFSKWAKWVLPKLLLLACICWASLIILNAVGWM